MKKLALILALLLFSSLCFGETFHAKWIYDCPDYEVRFNLYIKNGQSFNFLRTMQSKCTEAGKKTFTEDFDLEGQFNPGDNVVFALVPVNEDGVISPLVPLSIVPIPLRSCPITNSFGVWIKQSNNTQAEVQ